MKLKTLKDIEKLDMKEKAFANEIRQEAKEWIKDFNEMIDNHPHHTDRTNTDPLYLNCISCRNMFAQIVWIKHFFNL